MHFIGEFVGGVVDPIKGRGKEIVRRRQNFLKKIAKKVLTAHSGWLESTATMEDWVASREIELNNG